MARHEEGKVSKGWGQEIIWATNDLYCGKILTFKEGGKMSMHYHMQKHETWYVLEGSFMINKINTETAEKFISKKLLQFLSRIIGIILAALSIQFIIGGLVSYEVLSINEKYKFLFL